MRYFCGGLFADFVCCLNAFSGFLSPGAVATIDGADGRPLINAISNSGLSDETNCRIYRVVDAHTPAADGCNRMPDLRCINFGNEARTRRFYLKRFRDQRKKAGRVVANSWLATLRCDILTKTLECLSGAHNFS